MKSRTNTIVLAYSGGLDTSVAIPWLAERYRADVVTLTVDLGQGRELDDVRERALAIGAVRAHVIDAREEFARDFVLPALQAGAIYEDRYPLGTALGRPLIAKRLVDVARIEGASAVAHGSIGKANDHIRFGVLVHALEPSLSVLSPARDWDLTRPDKIEYARQRGIPAPATAESPFSTDATLWGRGISSGVLEDAWREPPEDAFALTRPVAQTPDTPAYVEIAFDRGAPVAINGIPMSLVELISSLETIAGAHGVGRIDMVENRVAGVKSREVYEVPAAVVLLAAHRELQRLVTPRNLDRLASELARAYADLVYDGLWFTPAREAIDAFVRKVQEQVTGYVRVRLFKGTCEVVGRKTATPEAEASAARPAEKVGAGR